MTELSEAARAMGRKGGRSTSPAKQAASRANGALARVPKAKRLAAARKTIADLEAKPEPNLEVPALTWDDLDQGEGTE